MKIYKSQNVFDAALDRIRFFFDEFDDVVIGMSGGKDSTVTFNLAMIVAKEKHRLPLKVLFLDQEIEWQHVIDYIKTVMYRPDVDPLWVQVPFDMPNSTSTTKHWLECWKEGDTWMRDREPIARTENIYGKTKFYDMFNGIMDVEHDGRKCCLLGGVRTEESPGRFGGLTNSATYKWITYGKVLNKKKEQYTFYPIYDWSYTDVWKAINDNDWDYCKIYDFMHRYGVATKDMRVSNLHHETSVRWMFILQEVEPETYEKAVQRLPGLDMAAKMGKDDYFVRKLPFMFASWEEYRDYLLDKLITNEKWKAGFQKMFKKLDSIYLNELGDKLYKTEISSILTNDFEYTKLKNFESRPEMQRVKKRALGVELW